VTPGLDELPARLHALGGRLGLAAFAAATTIAAAITAPDAAGSLPRVVATGILGASAVAGWTTLLAWHWLGRGKPLRLAPLVKFFRR
jgi:hypothetical protein